MTQSLCNFALVKYPKSVQKNLNKQRYPKMEQVPRYGQECDKFHGFLQIMQLYVI